MSKISEHLGNAKHIAVAFDVSGGISANMRDNAYSELNLAFSGKQLAVDIWAFDTDVHSHCHFAPYRTDDIGNFKPQWAGGTLVDCNWDYMRHKGIRPDLLFVFSDGVFLPSPKIDPEYVRTVWIIWGTDRISVPFGSIIRI